MENRARIEQNDHFSNRICSAPKVKRGPISLLGSAASAAAGMQRGQSGPLLLLARAGLAATN